MNSLSPIQPYAQETDEGTPGGEALGLFLHLSKRPTSQWGSHTRPSTTPAAESEIRAISSVLTIVRSPPPTSTLPAEAR